MLVTEGSVPTGWRGVMIATSYYGTVVRKYHTLRLLYGKVIVLYWLLAISNVHENTNTESIKKTQEHIRCHETLVQTRKILKYFLQKNCIVHLAMS